MPTQLAEETKLKRVLAAYILRCKKAEDGNASAPPAWRCRMHRPAAL